MNARRALIAPSPGWPRTMLSLLPPLVAFGFQFLFWDYFRPLVWFLFYPAIFCSSWIGGMRGGVLATLSSTALVWYFFIPPENSFAVNDTRALLSVGIFVGTGILFSMFNERLRSANQRILEESGKIQSIALNSAANAIVITDRSGAIEWANPAFTRLTGYDLDEVVGQNPRLLGSGKHDLAFYQSLWETVLSGQVWRGEVVNRRKDGSTFTEYQTITPVLNESGEIKHFVAIKEDISALKRTDEALKLFRALADQSNDLIEVVDPETGRLLDVNERGCLNLGYGRDEFLTLSVFDLDPTVTQAAFPTVVAELRKAGVLMWEGSHRRKDGSIFPVEVNIRFVQLDRDYAVAVVRDITERKQSEEALRTLNADLERRVEERTAELKASEARYSTLFHSTDEGFCIIEMIFDEREKPVDYRFLEINPAFERQTGLSEAVGKRMRELAPDHEEHWFETYGRIAMGGEAIRFQNHAEQLNRFYDVYACRIGEPKDRLVAILFNDITEERQMESALIEAKMRAEQANQAKSEFLSRMSHELRTPLNSVMGYAQLLDLQYEDPKIKEATRSILKGGRHLLQMINEVLDLSRIESGSLAISVEPIQIAGVLLQAVGLVQPIAGPCQYVLVH